MEPVGDSGSGRTPPAISPALGHTGLEARTVGYAHVQDNPEIRSMRVIFQSGSKPPAYSFRWVAIQLSIPGSAPNPLPLGHPPKPPRPVALIRHMSYRVRS